MTIIFVSLVFPHHVLVLESRREHVDRVDLKLLFEMQALEEGVRFLLGSIEGQHIGNGDDEIGHDEGAPEADEHAGEPAKEGFQEEVAIAHGRQGHYHAPHGIAKLVEVLLGHLRYGVFEYFKGIAEE